MELGVRKNLLTGQKANGCAGAFTVTGLGQRAFRHAQMVSLAPDMPVAQDFQVKGIGERIDDRNTNTVQASGHFVGIIVKLTPGVQHGHDDFGRGPALFLVHVHRDAPTVVTHADRAIHMNHDVNLVAVARQGLVNRVINHLEHHMVQTGSVIGITDVHPGPLTHGVQAF